MTEPLDLDRLDFIERFLQGDYPAIAGQWVGTARELLAEVKRLRAAGWLSSDEPPTTDGEYLVYTLTREVMIARWRAEYRKWLGYPGVAISVWRWMPLPEPPKMRKGGHD